MASPVAWDPVRSRLARELADLQEDDFVVLGEPAAPAGPPRGLLRRRTPPPATRYVQVRHDGDQLYAECVGATSFGGDWEIGPATHEGLREQGWLVPGEEDPSGVQPSFPNYWRVLPASGVDEAVRMCVDALTVLGADPTTLEWTRDR